MNFFYPSKPTYLIWIIIGMVLSFSSCQEKGNEVPSSKIPMACIEDPGTVTSGSNVYFSSACSANTTSFFWDFGNNQSSTEANPIHRFDKSGTYTVSLTAYNDDQENTITRIVEVGQPDFHLHNKEFINGDVTWEKGIHIIQDFVSVRSGTLTIEPGVIVKFMTNATLEVGYVESEVSAIIAEGTADAPILFTSAADQPAAGDWQSVFIGQYAAPTTSFAYATFEYGGNNYYRESKGLVTMNYGVSANINNCTFQHSFLYGIYLNQKSFFNTFTNNTFRNIHKYAIYIDGNKVASIGQNNNILNGGILVSLYGIDQDVRWEKQNCPYVIEGDLLLNSTTGSTLTIAPGARLEFFEDANLIVANSYNQFNKLIAEGTAEEPIVFTSHDQVDPVKFWGGMIFRVGTSPETSLKHCIVEKTAPETDSDAIIKLIGSTVNIEHSQISGSKKYGIDLDYTASLGRYNYNDIGEVASFSMSIPTIDVDRMGVGNTFSGKKRVNVKGPNLKEGKSFWRAIEVSYLVNSPIRVGSAGGTTLTLEAGTNIQFNVNATFEVGDSNYGPGSLIAVGTAQKPIILTKMPEIDGVIQHWDGLVFNSRTGTDSKLEYCNISHGQHNVKIYLTPAGVPTVSNCNITYANGYGIVVGLNTSPTLSNNTFSNNATGDIKKY